MNRISRRRLLTSGAAAGVLAAGGLAYAAQARRGGRLRIGLTGARPDDSWDARQFDSLFMIAAAQGCVFDCLTEVAADGTLRGELAQSWDVTPDARVWTLNLRRGVVFHNNKPFGAEDVLESFALHRRNSLATPLVEPIEDITAPSSHQVRFTLREGNPDFPYILSDYHLVIYPAGQVAESMAQGIGTGLYRVDRFAPGKTLIARRVGAHYKDGEAGWVDRIELHAMASADEACNAVAAGRLDAADCIPAERIAELTKDAAVDVRITPGNQHRAFDMRAFDPHMQLALRHGVDREAWVAQAMMGHGQVGADSAFGPTNAYFDTVPAGLFDPDRAAYHLARSETPAIAPGVRLPGIPVAEDAPALVSRHWYGRATEDWMLSALASHRPLPDGVANLQRAARSERNQATRATLYAEIQTSLAQSGATLVPAFEHFRTATRQSVGVPAVVGNLYPLDNARFAERWWRA